MSPHPVRCGCTSTVFLTMFSLPFYFSGHALRLVFLDFALMHSALSAFVDFLFEIYTSCSLRLERNIHHVVMDALKTPYIKYVN